MKKFLCQLPTYQLMQNYYKIFSELDHVIVSYLATIPTMIITIDIYLHTEADTDNNIIAIIPQYIPILFQ